MFRLESLQSTASKTSPHPFEKLIDQYGLLVIQKGEILVPSDNGKKAILRTPKEQSTFHLQHCGPVTFFEEKFFKDKEQYFKYTQSTNNKASSTDTFIENVIECYLNPSLEPRQDSLLSPLETFHNHSPLHNAPTTILQKKCGYVMDGLKPNGTQLDINNESFHKNRIIPVENLSKRYLLAGERSYNHTSKPHLYNTTFEKNNAKIRVEKDNNKYIFKTIHDEFTVKTEKGTYRFDEVTFNTKVHIGNTVELKSYPRTKKGYEHFFVHNSGNVCYASESRFQAIGMTLNSTNAVSNKDAYRLARVLEEGIANLKHGYDPSCIFATQHSALTHRLHNDNI